MNYYNDIKNKLIENENYARIKDYSKERYKVKTYYEIGKLLYEAGNKYGEGIIDEYSRLLIAEVGKKYNRSTLFRMKKLYQVLTFGKVAPVVPQLSWSHWILLIPIKNINELKYYMNQSITRNLSKRQLQEIIKNKEYDRLDKITKYKISKQEELSISDLVKNPILLKNSNKNHDISEKDLQNIILENVSSFLNELGNGFSFIRNEYRIKIGERYNYIDLLLFNFEYNCFVVVELKVTELKKEYIGQIEVYMNYVDDNIRKVNHDKTIGIIICKKDNHFIMQYCSDQRILSREYLLI